MTWWMWLLLVWALALFFTWALMRAAALGDRQSEQASSDFWDGVIKKLLGRG